MNMKRRRNGRFVKERDHARLVTLNQRKADESVEAVEPEISTENKSDSTTESGWGTGRRIVEIEFLANQLKSCRNCLKPIFLHNIIREKRIGYASIMYIKCDCGYINPVATGKTHRPANKTKIGMPVYDINTKAVLAVFHSGLTYRQMNGLMATMEVKGLHHSSMMRREEEIHPYVQETADESCMLVLQEELNTNKSTNEDQENEELNNCVMKYDMGWQKRGSGRAYDSKSGVGTLMGNNSGRICAYGVRMSDCRVCRKKGNTENIPPHNCAKNWSGSANAMESDVGVQLIKEVERKGVNVQTIIMDDDATTMAKIRKELDHSATKWSDKNHTSKHLTNSLYRLQQKHKALTSNVISYLQKCFNYALSQTEGDVEKCARQIQQIVPHSFGDHIKCDQWCGLLKNPETYKHGSLVKDLCGQELRDDLTAVFNVFSQNAEKIAPGGSTKEIESFNNMVASKAPKRCHFSASGNLLSRVGCAVAQKNMGNTYINTVNEKLGLSPGRVYRKVAESRDSERKRQREYSNKKENKLRKLQNKLKKRLEVSVKEKHEGTTYKTGVSYTHHSNISNIPTLQLPPELKVVSDINNCVLVFCDLETGSLAKSADILQIAACRGNEVFIEYVLPIQTISPAASRVTGLTASGGFFFLNGSPIPAMPLKDVLKSFIKWMEKVGKVVFIGHNFKNFDFPRLLLAFRSVGLEAKLKEVCVGGIDSLPMFKKIRPDMEKYSQEHIFEKLTKEKYCAHNALEDVKSLEKIFNFYSPSPDVYLKFSFTTEWGFENLIHQEKTALNAEILDCLVSGQVMSRQMVNKMASSGLRFEHLLSVFHANGKLGLVELLGERNGDKPRVTSCKKVIDSLYVFLTTCV